mmetsp:Transcript_41905/g.90540  ORF Transcript_41905/g.90540 Transcript_41905/m.90540 type:complete len:388 (-) Transcript_41905:398-1561(-)
MASAAMLPATSRPLLASLPDDEVSIQWSVQTTEEDEKRSRIWRIVKIVLCVALLLGPGIFFHTQVEAFLNDFLEWCAGLGWMAPVLLGALVGVLQLLMLPSFPLMVGAGAIFPRIFGFAVGQAVGVASVTAGMWFGSMIAFCMGRSLFKDWAEKELSDYAWMNVINAMVEEQGWWVILLARSSPFLPCEIFNYACALTSLSYRSYAIGCLGSVVPASLWICSTASAFDAIHEASHQAGHKAVSGGAPAPGGGNWKDRVLFIGVNVVFLVFLTLLLYLSVRKYTEKVNTYVDKEVSAMFVEVDPMFQDDFDQDDIRKTMTVGAMRLTRTHRFRSSSHSVIGRVSTLASHGVGTMATRRPTGSLVVPTLSEGGSITSLAPPAPRNWTVG